MDRSDYSVYFVTNPVEGGLERLLQLSEQILAGGVKILQLRDKNANTEELTEQARELLKLTKKYGAKLIVNDNVEAALASGADGVHLGQEDSDVVEARRLLGAEAIIGVSVRTPEEVKKAQAEGADYLGANGIFESRTKTDLPSPLGLEGIKSLCRATDLPLVAIGGINETNAAKVIESGADGVAVISAILKAQDINEACQVLRREVKRGFELRAEQEMALRKEQKR